MRMGRGLQTAKVPNAWRFYLPLYISAINMYLPSASEIKYK
ncbi:hypothetical protein [Chryseobacterium taihuense]|nr:hypothetical protein [Chryseobacterium taihuense]